MDYLPRKARFYDRQSESAHSIIYDEFAVAKCSPMTPFPPIPERKSDKRSLRVMAVVFKKPYPIPTPINTMSADEPVLNLHHLDKVHLFATWP